MLLILWTQRNHVYQHCEEVHISCVPSGTLSNLTGNIGNFSSCLLYLQYEESLHTWQLVPSISRPCFFKPGLIL